MPPPCTKMIRLRNRELLVAGFDPATSFCIRGLQPEWLASGAEVAAAVLHHAPLDIAATYRTGGTYLMSNLKIGMGCAQLTLGADIGVHAGTLVADGSPKYPSDVVM